MIFVTLCAGLVLSALSVHASYGKPSRVRTDLSNSWVFRSGFLLRPALNSIISRRDSRFPQAVATARNGDVSKHAESW
jgi:hypothetical protein